MTTPAHCYLPYPDAPVASGDGPLADLEFSVKDIFDLAGYPTGCGNPHALARSGIKTTTAPTVQRLLDSGARFTGKTLTDELAFSMNGKNAHFGTPRNGAVGIQPVAPRCQGAFGFVAHLGRQGCHLVGGNIGRV